MTSKTEQIAKDFLSKLDNTYDYTLKEMTAILTTSYKELSSTKGKKKASANPDQPVVKKLPSAYNLFVKEEISKIKAANPSVNPKELMKLAADNWKLHKEQQAQQA
jgi:hypothetical protein